MKIDSNLNLAECGYGYDEEDNIDYDFWDDYLFDETMTEYLKRANRYLVFAIGVRWNGASGYKFADDYSGAIFRSYDNSMYPVKCSKGKKTLVCKEYSHDVPMGSTTIIVALTDKEYDKLNNSDFGTVESFARKMYAMA